MRGRRGRSESYFDIAVEAAAHLRAYRVYALNRKFLCILCAVLAEDNRVLLRHDARDEHRATERAEPLALTDGVVHYALMPADDVALYIEKIALAHVFESVRADER